MAESKYGGPEHLPPIVYTDAGIGSYIGADVAAIAQMWQQVLGVEITVENEGARTLLRPIDAGQHGQVFSGGWCADYPDPENFADVLFYSGSAQNSGRYATPSWMRLLEAARVEQDVANASRCTRMPSK